MKHIFITLRLIAATVLICCVAYPALIFAIGQIITPHTANGSLISDKQGRIIGSELIAQKFSKPGYFWARPSAVDYNGAGSGGSNLSPANPALRKNAQDIMADYGTKPEMPIPADLVTASGSGLDPHITLTAAMYQVQRVADARKISPDQLQNLIKEHSFTPGLIFTSEPLVNVLLVNQAMDIAFEAITPYNRFKK